jgi:protease-4
LIRAVWRGLDIVRRSVHLFLMLIVLLALLVLLSDTPITVPDTAAMMVAPTGRLVEQLAGDPLELALRDARGEADDQALVRDLVTAIERAAEDKRIKALVLSLDGFQGGDLTKLSQVATALDAYKESGKPLIAAGDAYGQSQYYLAARADEIYMHPLGEVFFRGFGYYRTYFREALDKILVDGNVFRTGEYKSAYDPYLRDDMSVEERSEARILVDQLWGAYRKDVSSARGLDPDSIQALADNYLDKLKGVDGDQAVLAIEEGLVDQLWTRDQIRQHLIGIVGENDEGDDYPRISYQDYLAATDLVEVTRKHSANEIAVIVATGTILPGDRAPGNIGGRSMTKLIREARQDDDVKAVVLRVDSGGGSQFASEVILAELELLRDSGKPLVVSMGGIAASGGYIISLPGQEIWAHPETITGSIGVVALLATFERAFEKLGLTVDGVGTTPRSDDFRLGRSLSPETREIIQLSIDSGYERFLAQVAGARKLQVDEVRSIAGGRVFTGRDAHHLGLVDELGGLEEAVASVADMAGLGGNYQLRYLEPKIDFQDSLVLRFLTGLARVGQAVGLTPRVDPVSAILERIDREISPLLSLDDPRGIFYLCLCGIDNS